MNNNICYRICKHFKWNVYEFRISQINATEQSFTYSFFLSIVNACLQKNFDDNLRKIKHDLPLTAYCLQIDISRSVLLQPIKSLLQVKTVWHMCVPLTLINASPLSGSYMRQWIWSALIQIRPIRRQAILPTNAKLLSIEPFRSKLRWNLYQNTKRFIH